VPRILRSVGFAARAFTSGALLLAEPDNAAADCIVLDLWMPMTGLEVQQALVRAGNATPVIFISAHGDVPNSVQARSRLASAAHAERTSVAQRLKTIKVHRSRLQAKMGMRSIAELVSRIERAGLREYLMRSAM
jgi:FixJ family two-component response regulator